MSHAGLSPRALEDPGDEARHRGLAVCARDGDHVTPPERVPGEPGRPGLVVEPFVQHVLDGRVAAGHGVPDHHPVGCGVEVLRPISLAHRDPRLRQHIAHRRIEAGIRPLHLVPELARDAREGGHEGASDPEDVDAHGCVCVREGGPVRGSEEPVDDQGREPEERHRDPDARGEVHGQRMAKDVAAHHPAPDEEGEPRNGEITPAAAEPPPGSAPSSSATRGKAITWSTAPVPAKAAKVCVKRWPNPRADRSTKARRARSRSP